MKAIVINEFGDADKLQISEVQKPVPADNQVLVRVKAAGLNPVDTKIRAGKHISCSSLQLPAVLGKDMSGIVEAIGKDVQRFQVGDAVFGCIDKTYAEYVVADEDAIAKKPVNISFEEAAAVSLAGFTAYQAINDHLKVQSGQRILIQSAAGGVGHLAVQFAKINGAVVSGTASEKNAGFLEQIGVDQFIDYRKEKFEDIVSDLDAVMDTMGGEILYRSIESVKSGGRVVCLPSSTKDDPQAIALARERGVELIWFMMKPQLDMLELMAEMLEREVLKVEVMEAYLMQDIIMAHRAIESQHVRGKLVVKMN